MEQTYDLNVWDALGLLEQQLASPEFEGQFEYVPFQEFDSDDNCVYSHLMSAFWANREAVCSLVCSGLHPLIYNSGYRLQKIHGHTVLC